MMSTIQLGWRWFAFPATFLALFFPLASHLSDPSARAAETISLKFATIDSPDSMIGRAQNWFLTRVEELSNGRIKFERHWSNSLVPPRELLDALTNGVTDVSFVIPQFTPAKTPLLTVQTLPTNHEDLWIIGRAMHDYNQEPYVKEELARRNAVYLTSMPLPVYNVLLKKPVSTLEDLKGLKIWASGEQATLIKALGAVPVTIPTPEVYTALERGTLDGAGFPPLLLVDFGMYEAGKFLWKLPLGLKSSLLAIRSNVWTGLPADLQEIMKTAAMETLAYGAAYHQIVQTDGNNNYAITKMKAAGITVAEVPDEVKARLASLVVPMWNDWAEKMDNRGLPGRKAADTFRELLDKYAAELPKK
jgi:TRAP-type C4-dicarboxylate transport system substrate-binding protein